MRQRPTSCSAIRERELRGFLYMNDSSPGVRERDESPSAALSLFDDNPSMFQLLFERSADAIWLFDPQAGVFMDCNSAAVELMRAGSKEKLLGARPEDLSPPLQSDGTSSREKTAQVIALVEERGSHRFEWVARRFDGREVPLEVLLTPICASGRNLHVVFSRDITERKRTEAALRESEQKFRGLFEASSDAIQIIDPQERRIVDCNAATLKMIDGGDKDWFLKQPVESLSPERQPNGRPSREVGRAWTERALTQGPQRFEWVGKRFNGEEFPVEILLTPMQLGGRRMLVSVSREISERKKAEQELVELNQSLERRVAERTAALTTSEAQFRALVEHAPEAIVVFNGDTGRFLFGNEHACALYGVPMERLTELTPADVSPELQPNGRRSSELARELMAEALAGGMPVFEWTHQQQPHGRLIPTEVRLLRLPAEGQNLIRASIINNAERKLAERALRESEAKFRALFEGASQGVVLHDEERILQVNPAAVRILGRQSAREVLGKHPGAFSPPTQTNGESSDALARKHIDDCITNGSARFDWLACAPDGREIPMEVMLTRIEWSGRQIIQAFITDISERKRAQAALAESEALFSAAFEASPILIVIARMSDQKYVLVNDAFVNWSGCSREELLGRDSNDFGIWESRDERDAVWADLRRDGSIHERECRFRTRKGDLSTMLISFEVIQINHAPHVLAMGLDITGRKRAEEASNASEARLRESEARFSAAFHASPAFLGVLSLSDGKYVLVNEAYLNWLGYPREEVVGHTCLELRMWENPNDRDLLLNDMHAIGSVRQRELRWRNRLGERSTILLSAETIKLDDTPHMLIMAVDITKRKRSEEELRESEARLRESEARFSAAFQASPFFITILRMEDGVYVLVNDAFVNWLGCSREEIIGRTSAEFGMWENPEERASALNDMRTLGSIRQREVHWHNRHGEHLIILLSAETIRLNGIPHILSSAQDITQRKRAEEELRSSEARVRESEARFSAAFRASPVFITISRMDDGRFTLANEAYLKWTGYRMDEILGRNSEELSLWADPADRAPFWEELRRAGLIRERECRVRSRHGQIFTMLISADIIQVNREPHLLTVGLDIGQRKQAEAELQRTLAREKELSQLKSNFVSMVSHEFRTPLGIIQSSAELLRDFHERMPPAERHEQLESISRNTRRMAGMMEEVLVLSRLDAGKLDFQPAALDLNNFCRRVVDEVLSATNRRCPIELSLNSIPSEARADERLLGHIFTNLLSNAVKYSEAGATVHFLVESEGPDAVCMIRDQGIGIPEEDQQQLFKAFHRGSNVGTRPGTGLGLLLVKRCADLHGGKLALNSKIGEGTTVTIRLPVFRRHP